MKDTDTPLNDTTDILTASLESALGEAWTKRNSGKLTKSLLIMTGFYDLKAAKLCFYIE